MILKTKTFQEAANKILVAVGLDRANANLELAAKDNALFLRVTNREQYAAVRFELEQPIAIVRCESFALASPLRFCEFIVSQPLNQINPFNSNLDSQLVRILAAVELMCLFISTKVRIPTWH